MANWSENYTAKENINSGNRFSDDKQGEFTADNLNKLAENIFYLKAVSDGLPSVILQPSKTVKPTKSEQIITADKDEGYTGLQQVVVEGADIKSLANLQTKEIYPLDKDNTVKSDVGYDGLKEVVVKAVPVASGSSATFTKNGIYTAPSGQWYEKVTVNVSEEGSNSATFRKFVDGSITKIEINDWSLDGENPITEIAPYSFVYRQNLTYVALPSTIETIWAYAFQYCTNLEILDSADAFGSLTKIGDGAFWDTGFTYFDIPRGVDTLYQQTFAYCEKLEKVSFNGRVTYIGDYAFYECKNLKRIDLSSTDVVPTLESVDAFYGLPSDYQIKVRSSLLDEFLSASNWASLPIVAEFTNEG